MRKTSQRIAIEIAGSGICDYKTLLKFAKRVICIKSLGASAIHIGSLRLQLAQDSDQDLYAKEENYEGEIKGDRPHT
jgi:hypothetical protein